jgi:hypothetical protein
MWSDIKTTICGIVGGTATFIALNPTLISGDHAALVTTLAAFVAGGGFAALGITAKDSGKGSDRPQEVVDAKLSSVPPIEPPAEAAKYTPTDKKL